MALSQQPLLPDKPLTDISSKPDSADIHSNYDGLSTAEAGRRLLRDGPNELAEDYVNPCLKFLGYFWGPMPCMIWIAIVVESITSIFESASHWLDVGVLVLLQTVNGLVGWYEERNAGNAIAALKKELALLANVKRDGVWLSLPARELVQGDVVHLKLGDLVPADCELLPNLGNLPIQVDQSALNGESLPKTMYSGETALQGAVVKRGEIDALITATGVNTFFGRASLLMSEVDKKRNGSGMSVTAGGHFQKLVTKLTLGLLFLSLTLVIILSIRLFAIGEQSALEIISTGVVLLVASIPIAMQVVCTSTMAVGAHNLASREALVCKLTAIEEMAAMDVLCSDKTGTLTLNKLSIKEPWVLKDLQGYKSYLDGSTCENPIEELVMLSALAAKQSGDAKDAIDQVITDWVCDRIEHGKQLLSSFEQSHFVPFDPVSKRTEATVEWTGKGPQKFPFQSKNSFQVAKGAPQVVLAMCHNYPQIEDVVTEKVNSYASRGFRTIGVAVANVETSQSPQSTAASSKTTITGGTGSESSSTSFSEVQWQFVGLVPLRDECRPRMREIIQKAFELGVTVKMITGDQTAIARETCRELDMGSVIYNADILATSSDASTAMTPLQQKELKDAIEGGNGFAEVFPEHKYQIVTVLQENGHRVGMTGDGVNDAPALKAADIGIAVADATDAARAASDIVLTCEGLGVIIEAIARARMIFERMRNYCIYRISCTIQLLFFFFVAMMFFSPANYLDKDAKVKVSEGATFQLPVLCLVMITLLNDGCILSIAYDFVAPSMQPSVWKLPELIATACAIGACACFGILMLLIIGLNGMNMKNSIWKHFWGGVVRLEEPLTYIQVQTMMYLAVSVSGFMILFAARTRGAFFSRKPSLQLFCATVFALTASTLISTTDLIGASDGDLTIPDGLSAGLPWEVILFVWCYCLVFFLIEDTAKSTMIRLLEKKNGVVRSDIGNTIRESFWQLKDSVLETGNGTIIANGSSARSVLLRQSLSHKQSVCRDSIVGKNSIVSANRHGVKQIPGGLDAESRKNGIVASSCAGESHNFIQVGGGMKVSKPGDIAGKGGKDNGERPSCATTAAPGSSGAFTSSVVSTGSAEV